MVQVTSRNILVAIRGLFVCLLTYYSKTYEWISMKFLGKIEDGTSNEPLNFGSALRGHSPSESLRSPSASSLFIYFLKFIYLFSYFLVKLFLLIYSH